MTGFFNKIFFCVLIFLAGCSQKDAFESGIININYNDPDTDRIFTLALLQDYTLDLVSDGFLRDIRWKGSDPDIITVDISGKVSADKPGKAVIFYESDSGSMNGFVNVEVIADPMFLFEKFHIDKTLRKEIKNAYSSESQFIDGSVSLYWTGALNQETRLIDININQYTGLTAAPSILASAETLKKVRPGIMLEEIQYIAYHDTGNYDSGANADMHAGYIAGDDNASFRARSWHYTVDSAKVIQHVPDNEVTWHGDSYDSYAKSIGIETCVNYGSDFYSVWQRTGKLIAMLLVKYDLGINAVKQHYDFSRKICPEILIYNNLYETAMEIISAEYIVQKYLKEYNIVFQSLNTAIVDHHGKVINTPLYDTEVGYIVTIENQDAGYRESRVFYSIVAGEQKSAPRNK